MAPSGFNWGPGTQIRIHPCAPLIKGKLTSAIFYDELLLWLSTRTPVRRGEKMRRQEKRTEMSWVHPGAEKEQRTKDWGRGTGPRIDTHLSSCRRRWQERGRKKECRTPPKGTRFSRAGEPELRTRSPKKKRKGHGHGKCTLDTGHPHIGVLLPLIYVWQS